MSLTLPTTLSPDAPNAVSALSKDSEDCIDLIWQWVSDDRWPIVVSLAWTHGRGGAYLVHGEGATPAEALLDLLSDAEGYLDNFQLTAAAILLLRDLAHEAVDAVCQSLSGEPLDSAVFAEEVPA